MPRANADQFPEIKQILDRLKLGRPHETLCLFVPSHDRHGKDLNDEQSKYATQGLSLFGELYGGATAFKFCEGVYQPPGMKKPLFDSPIMLQTLTGREKVEKEESLVRLGQFCREVVVGMDQVAVGLVINNYFIDIQIAKKK